MPIVSESQSFVIAVELGSAWPEWLSQRTTATRRVVSELEGEGPAVFAARAAQELSQRSLTIQEAVVLCNERADAAQIEARRSLARDLLGRSGKSTLTLLAPTHASDRLHFTLDALATELGRRVVVRYGDATLEAEIAIPRVA